MRPATHTHINYYTVVLYKMSVASQRLKLLEFNLNFFLHSDCPLGAAPFETILKNVAFEASSPAILNWTFFRF